MMPALIFQPCEHPFPTDHTVFHLPEAELQHEVPFANIMLKVPGKAAQVFSPTTGPLLAREGWGDEGAVAYHGRGCGIRIVEKRACKKMGSKLELAYMEYTVA